MINQTKLRSYQVLGLYNNYNIIEVPHVMGLLGSQIQNQCGRLHTCSLMDKVLETIFLIFFVELCTGKITINT